ncbi:MAG: biotin--[acetyl-CoA-carboxylase] ligase [Rhodospirillales bacterium]|nr:biotin--[acetyl-CoA-carboxylase] ligase [Rhodospirillales bacterium]
MAPQSLPDFFQPMRFGRVGSTNEELRRLAALGAAEGSLIVATEQTAGRGRHQRPWSSPPGNLYASLLLRPDRPMPAALEIGFVVAVALADALTAQLTPAADVRLKWPNDVLIGGRKVAGILMEADGSAAGGINWLVVGLGVNIASHPPAAMTAYPATSLWAEGATGSTVEQVLAQFGAAFLEGYRRWLGDGFAPVRRAWLARAFGRGSTVDVRIGAAATVRGRFLDLAEDGALVLEEEGGRQRRLTVGDVFPLPATA